MSHIIGSSLSYFLRNANSYDQHQMNNCVVQDAQEQVLEPVQNPLPPLESLLNKLGDNITDLFTIKVISEAEGLWGLNLPIKENENDDEALVNLNRDRKRKYKELLNPEDNRTTAHRFRQHVYSLNLGFLKTNLIDKVVYPCLNFLLRELIHDFKDKTIGLCKEFIEKNEKDNFESFFTEKLNFSLEFFNDLEKSLGHIVNSNVIGGSINNSLELLFRSPSSDSHTNIKTNFDQVFSNIPHILTEKLTPQLRLAQKVRDHVWNYTYINKIESHNLNFEEEAYNAMASTANLIIKIVVSALASIPWLFGIYLPQLATNFYIRKIVNQKIGRILQDTLENTIDFTDEEGYTYDIDRIILKNFNDLTTQIENPSQNQEVNDQSFELNPNLRSLLYQNFVKILNIAPLLDQDKERIQEGLADPNKAMANLIEDNVGKIGALLFQRLNTVQPTLNNQFYQSAFDVLVSSLEKSLPTVFTKNRLEMQARQVLASVNTIFYTQQEIPPEEKIITQQAKNTAREKFIKSLMDLICKNVSVTRVWGVKELTTDRVSRILKAYLKGIGSLLKNPITTKFWVCVYMVAKPYYKHNNQSI
ncbi:MAG: hypothetical protein ACOVOR_00205 [Rhabdochlamydiaceae bacterium]